MDITVKKEGIINVIDLNGNFDIASSTEFDNQLMALIDAGETRILLDFSQVSFIASTGLRMLLKTAQRIKDENGLLHLCCINKTVQDVFKATGFDEILTVFDTKEQALIGLE
jgi:anti-anti-sigma factor